MKHIAVLQQEVISVLNLRSDSVVVDCTLGSGGHAALILQQLGKSGTYIGIDVDPTAIKANSTLQEKTDARVLLVEGNFRNIRTLLSENGITQVDAIIADLGWRTEQFEGTSGVLRGFSFKHDEPLAMTFGEPARYPFTAYDIVNSWEEEDIANVIYAYGEERHSRRIARAIVARRVQTPIETSKQLAEVVRDALPAALQKKRIHPATKTFQALRIAVNDEFDALKELLAEGFETLAPKGRMAIISFHSLEDRIVKETFRTFVRDQKAMLVHKKPLEAHTEELEKNPRARSAKLRTIEKI